MRKCIERTQRRILIVKSCVEFYHECWKRRCVVLHNLENQKKLLMEEILVIIEEASKEEVERLRRYVEVNFSM